ncbi:hypothetical protein [Paracoccus homiensis]|uniref:Uncharacterized protein n=1 Tax=Paracoccus homiensis TaxID=364199 RepID=A0A1I0GU40_9RHOB|nr:hypothetical protein [Paracoccus homiensis]SET74687.1 hypothetical protein SAMN04489858_10982 [Paracoccus homiensis]
MRAYLAAGALAAVLSALGLAYWQGRGAGEADRLRDHISTRERMDEVDTSFDGCGWFDRLREACE